MNNSIRRFVAIVGMGLGLMMPINKVFADSESEEFKDSESFKKLSAQWWQWALSIPPSVNPQLDQTGEDAVVGQHGPVWFLAGFFGGGTATRDVNVPEGAALFLPVINSVNINVPNVCGQGPDNLSVRDLRKASAAFINGAVNLSVTVDGKAMTKLRRVQSKVFSVALPDNNLFDALCTGAGLGDVPGGIYSPAVDEGIYVLLDPLDIGKHALHFHAENPSQNFIQDVTYNITVVPVLEK
jgi:hypothetical protein